ncbi:MAG: hypothetical protein HQM10_13160 [Candidatus Riflebacteria bacterium]|nr:hypothetical protein [Candidatus Riflebacteria bacterium]
MFFKEGEPGKPDTVILKTEDGDYGVLPSDSLNELINTENFEFTEYLFEGKRLPGEDGKIKFLLNKFTVYNPSIASHSTTIKQKTDVHAGDFLPFPKKFGIENKRESPKKKKQK